MYLDWVALPQRRLLPSLSSSNGLEMMFSGIGIFIVEARVEHLGVLGTYGQRLVVFEGM